MVPNSNADTHIRELAIECAAAEAKRYWFYPQAFRRAIRGVNQQLEKYARAAYRIRRREIVRYIEPYLATRPRDLRPLPEGRGLDPWSLRKDELERTSRVICACPECGEAGGRRSCRSCEGSGVVSAWLTIHEEHFVTVSVSLEYLAARVHPKVASAEDFDHPPDQYPAYLELDTGWNSELTDVAAVLQPALDPLIDRVQGIRLQTFLTPIYSITYKTRQGRGTIDVAGRIPRVMPWSNFSPLRLRLVVAMASGALILAAAVVVALLLPGWSALPGSGPVSAVVTAVVLASVLTAVLRSRKVWRYVRRKLPIRLGGRPLAHTFGEGSNTTRTETALTGS